MVYQFAWFCPLFDTSWFHLMFSIDQYLFSGLIVSASSFLERSWCYTIMTRSFNIFFYFGYGNWSGTAIVLNRGPKFFILKHYGTAIVGWEQL